MPIKIPNELPATETLHNENIFVITEKRAVTQDIRPLKILLFNLMPTKIVTETQFARLLGNSPLQVEMEFLQTASHKATHVDESHMISFYKTFDEIKDLKFDGMIITGAPVEHMPFEEVSYWDELCEIMDWSKTHVTSTLHICWAAQAGLYHRYGIPKIKLPQKLFGIYPHVADYKNSILLRGFDDVFMVPQSRHTTVNREDVEAVDDLKVVSSSDEGGVFIAMTDKGRQIYVTGHLEYDADTLQKEYERDLSKGENIQIPKNYFPDDNPSKPPLVTWRSYANLFYSNWLNYFVYQTTPYDIETIE